MLMTWTRIICLSSLSPRPWRGRESRSGRGTQWWSSARLRSRSTSASTWAARPRWTPPRRVRPPSDAWRLSALPLPPQPWPWPLLRPRPLRPWLSAAARALLRPWFLPSPPWRPRAWWPRPKCAPWHDRWSHARRESRPGFWFPGRFGARWRRASWLSACSCPRCRRRPGGLRSCRSRRRRRTLSRSLGTTSLEGAPRRKRYGDPRIWKKERRKAVLFTHCCRNQPDYLIRDVLLLIFLNIYLLYSNMKLGIYLLLMCADTVKLVRLYTYFCHAKSLSLNT